MRLGSLRDWCKRLLYMLTYYPFRLSQFRRDRLIWSLRPPQWSDLPPPEQDVLAKLNAERSEAIEAMKELFRSPRVLSLCARCAGYCCRLWPAGRSPMGITDWYLTRPDDVDVETLWRTPREYGLARFLLNAPVSLSGLLRSSLTGRQPREQPTDTEPVGWGDTPDTRERMHTATASRCRWLAANGCSLSSTECPSVCAVWLCDDLRRSLSLQDMEVWCRNVLLVNQVEARTVKVLRKLGSNSEPHLGRASKNRL